MKILTIKPMAVGRVLGVLYAIYGVGYAIYAVASRVQEIIVPFGFVAPVFHANLNVHLQLDSGPLWRIVLLLWSIASLALSGWITGFIGTLCFNLISKRLGGIEASSFVEESSQAATVER